MRIKVNAEQLRDRGIVAIDNGIPQEEKDKGVIADVTLHYEGVPNGVPKPLINEKVLNAHGHVARLGGQAMRKIAGELEDAFSDAVCKAVLFDS